MRWATIIGFYFYTIILGGLRLRRGRGVKEVRQLKSSSGLRYSQEEPAQLWTSTIKTIKDQSLYIPKMFALSWLYLLPYLDL